MIDVALKSTNVAENDTHRELTYELLTEFSQAASISEDWDRLLERSRCNRAFSCSKWYLATPKLYPNLKPLVLVARRHSTIAGIMPLVIDEAGSTASFQGNWSAYSDILAEDRDLAAMTGLLRIATSDLGHYERLLLRRVRRDSNCLRALQTVDGLRAEEPFLPGESEFCSYADLSGGYEFYMKTRSKNFRHNLNRVRNKADREGVTIRELGLQDFDPSRIPETFMWVHESRFGGRTVLGSSASFLDELFPHLFRERRMKVFALMAGGRILGMHLSMVGRNSLVGWNAGFLPEVASLSPGRLLLDEAIRQACMQEFEEYDFREGDEPYKEGWKTGVREIGQLEFITRADATQNG